MNPHPIDQYLNVITGCLGAEFDYLFDMPDDERDVGFKLNFANKQEQIISNVNALVLPDLRFFSYLLEAFISEVKANFNSADAHQAKQRYADRIAAKVDIIQKGVERLARTLRDEWSLPQDPRFSYFFSHRDVELYGQRVQREMHLKELINSSRTEEEAQAARRSLDAYRSERREGEFHIYFALLIADWTERFLSSYLALYCSRIDAPIIYNKSSPDDLIIISPSSRGSQKVLLSPSDIPNTSPTPTTNSNKFNSQIKEAGAPISLMPPYLDLFDSEDDARSCLRLMHNYNLIGTDGTNRIGAREKYRLMALVEVLQQKHLLAPALSTAIVTAIVAQQIKMPYRRARNGDRKGYDLAMSNYFDKLNAVSRGELTWSILADNGR